MGWGKEKVNLDENHKRVIDIKQIQTIKHINQTVVVIFNPVIYSFKHVCVCVSVYDAYQFP